MIHAAIADFEHVRIIPMSGAGKWFEAILVESDNGHPIVVICDVFGRAPQVAAHRGAPSPDALVSVLTQAEDNGPATSLQRIVHLLIHGLHFAPLVDSLGAAPVIFQV